jgi:hypothetical protein
MTNASQAISLLLVGTGICAYGFDASQRRYRQQSESEIQSAMPPTTQPGGHGGSSSSYPGYYYGNSYHNGYYYGNSYHSGSWGGSNTGFHPSDFSHGSTVRGGFGGHGHASGS